MRSVPLWVRWAVLGVVLVVALLIGSGVFDSPAPTLAQRAASLDAQLKCPSCEDLSVAESTAPSSLAVRAEVRAGLAHGLSDQEIIAQLRARYGNEVLLTPPPGPFADLLWGIPVLIGVGIVVVVAVVLFRRRSPRAAPSEGVPR